MQRWQMVQQELLPELRSELGALTPKLERVVHTLEWVRIEEVVGSTWRECGRPEHDRGMLANAFVAKAVLGLSTTAGLIERLSVDRALKRICGFPMWKNLPDESTFSRAFAEFAESGVRVKHATHKVFSLCLWSYAALSVRSASHIFIRD